MQDTATGLTAQAAPSTDVPTACRACGTWVCDDCGAKLADASRFSGQPHHCPKCSSAQGRMAPVVHRARRANDHEESYQRGIADGGLLRYPVSI
jgi:hypothetical protein